MGRKKFTPLVVRIFGSGAEWKNRLKMNQINIGYDHIKTLVHTKKEIYTLSSQKLNEIGQNLSFILSHLQELIFPRNMMTRALGYQKEVFNIKEVLEYSEHQTLRTVALMRTLHLLNMIVSIELHQVF